MNESLSIEYRKGVSALPSEAFLTLVNRVWPRDYDAAGVTHAGTKSINVGAWHGERLVGSVRVLSDGYLFNTVAELLVDPEFQRRGIGRTLMHHAIALAPGGRIFFGAQPGNEPFFDKIGCRRGPTGFVGCFEDFVEKPLRHLRLAASDESTAG